MRRLLQVATLLVFLAGLALFVAPERTDEWFAWTVNPPVTAAFLGAAYWASATVEWTSARAATWAHARVAVPSVVTFTTLTLLVTLAHLDKFHLADDEQALTRGIAWAWIAIYAIVPLLLAVVWARQRRGEGADPERSHPLPAWLRACCAVMAVCLLGLGAWLLMRPEQVAEWWPWDLTRLTGQAIGAWFVGLGVSAISTVVEGDARRVRPVAIGAVTLALLAAVALLRYPSDVTWSGPGAVVVVVLLTSWSVLGVVLLASARAAPQQRGALT
jgi:hypothetical protein